MVVVGGVSFNESLTQTAWRRQTVRSLRQLFAATFNVFVSRRQSAVDTHLCTDRSFPSWTITRGLTTSLLTFLFDPPHHLRAKEHQVALPFISCTATGQQESQTSASSFIGANFNAAGLLNSLTLKLSGVKWLHFKVFSAILV